MSGEAGAGQGSSGGSSAGTAAAPSQPANGGSPPSGADTQQGSGQGSPTSPPQQPRNGAQGGTDNSLASGFLQQIPEEHRGLLEPYVKQWDAGVTRRFQDLHSQYAPFKGLLEAGATPEQVDLAWTVFQLLDNDPKALRTVIDEVLGEVEGQGNEALPGANGEDDPYEGLHPQVAEQLRRQDVLIENMAQWILAQNQQTTQATEDQQLDSYLDSLKQQYGEFDEEYVLSLMAAGFPGDVAIQKFQSLTQGFRAQAEATGQGPSAQVPPILSGGGVTPSQKPIEEASPQETRNLVADLLRQSNRQGK